MKYLITADWHLELRNSLDDSNYWRLKQMLSMCIKKGYHAILAGDIFGCWETGCDHIAILQANPEIRQLLGQLRAEGLLTILNGNHDQYSYTHEELLVLGKPSHPVFILHGHQYDPYNSTYARVGHALTRAGEALQIISPDLPDRLEGKFRILTAASRSQRIADKLAAKYFYAKNSTVIFAHSHFPKDYKDAYAFTRIINVGSFTHSDASAVFLHIPCNLPPYAQLLDLNREQML